MSGKLAYRAISKGETDYSFIDLFKQRKSCMCFSRQITNHVYAEEILFTFARLYHVIDAIRTLLPCVGCPACREREAEQQEYNTVQSLYTRFIIMV